MFVDNKVVDGFGQGGQVGIVTSGQVTLVSGQTVVGHIIVVIAIVGHGGQLEPLVEVPVGHVKIGHTVVVERLEDSIVGQVA